jgi:hypothetical protein
VTCVHAEAPYDGVDGDALVRVAVAPAAGGAPAVDDVAVALAVGDVLAVDGAAVALAVDSVLPDGVAPAAPSSEHGEAQMNRLRVRSQAPKGEHYPESLEFPGQMELRLPVEFPGPLAPAQRMVFVPRLPASMAATSLAGPSHSHRSGVLEIEDYHVPSPHWANRFEE